MAAPTSIENMIRRTGHTADADRWHLLSEDAVVDFSMDGTRATVTYVMRLGEHAHRWMDESSYADLDRGERREVCTRCGQQRTVANGDTPDE